MTGNHYHAWEVEYSHKNESNDPICKLIVTKIPGDHSPGFWEITEHGPLKADALLISRYDVRYTTRPII